MVKRYHPVDDDLLFAEALTLAADDIVQRNAADYIVDLGNARYDGTLVIYVSAAVVANADNLYTFILEGSSSATFASDIVNLAYWQIGHATAMLGNGATSSTGLWDVPFHNSPAGIDYRYARLNVLVAGTSKSITFNAHITRPTLGAP